MISVEEALTIIKDKMPDWGTEIVSFEGLPSAEVAEDLVSDRDYPPFHRVMMDGIAVSYSVYSEGKRTFLIAGVCAAGMPQAILSDPSTCLEVMTGAPLPEGADLVIPYEHLKIEHSVANIILEQDRAHFENVHHKGSDAHKGDVLLKKNHDLNGPHWGIATSLGYASVKIKKSPRIAIISTGDELVSVEAMPLDHQIRRSNAYALKSSLVNYGYHDIKLFHLNDSIEVIEKYFKEESHNFDLMIFSGGVSKGKFDYLPSTWKSLGVTEHFHGISQRPGKPLWFGTKEKLAVIGLPGNPVSSLVCLHRYILSTKKMYAQLSEDITFKKDMTYFVPVSISYLETGVMQATPLKIKNSGEFSALAGSDGFLELPKEKTIFKAGEAYLFHPWIKQ